MVRTASHMLPLGTEAPDFTLPDAISHQHLNLSDLKSDIATVIMFICNHCPYVIHIQKELVNVANQYQAKGIRFIAISSNDVDQYPADGPDEMNRIAKDNHYPFPYLFDESQAVAKAYHAACTPDFFIFDKNLTCIYRGRFDESTPGNNKPVTGMDLKNALDNILIDRLPSDEQYPSLGCNIKWKEKSYA